MSADPLAELFACQSPSQPALDWFMRKGVPVAALAYPWAIAFDAVLFSGARFEFARHRPSDEAVRAIILPALDEWAEPVDLIAWQPKSGDLGSWLGRVAMLGEEQVFGPRLGGPLIVHETPLDWLRAERRGVVVIDARRAAPRLRDAGTLAVENVAQGKRLRAAMAVRLPRILVAMREAA